MKAITSHAQPELPGDVNNSIKIETNAPAGNVAATRCTVTLPDVSLVLPFYNAKGPGLTNEALLAIVYDRLLAFQQGDNQCPENECALGHVSAALHHLKRRTARLLTENDKGETKMGEDPKPKGAGARVRLEDTTLFIGSIGFPAGALAKWNTWSIIEREVKRLDPQLTTAEMSVIEQAAAHLGAGARNGLAELKSALASTKLPG